jgi:CARDB
MLDRRLPVLVLCLCALAVAAGPAQATPAKKKPDLRAATVTSPGFARAGDDLSVSILARNAGARVPRKTKARVYLSADRRRSKGDVALRAVPVRRLAARDRVTLTAAVRLPKGVSGARYVIACVDDPARVRERNERNNCMAAKAPLTIKPAAVAAGGPAAAAKTSAGLIAAELAAGRITQAQALTYRVYAMFGDARLPTRLAGEITAAEDDSIMREVADAWPSLSKASRRAVAPYLAPPHGRVTKRKGKAKAASAPVASAAQSEGDEREDPCEIAYYKGDWQSVAAAGGKVRVNWRSDRPADKGLATSLAGDVTTAYARFKQIMRREPLPDGKVPCYHGPDGALDIYISNVYGGDAVTVPAAKTTYTTPACDGMPSFIVVDPQGSGVFTKRFTVAHELFHAFQNAFRYAAGCKEYKWFDEGSANWAAHKAFPADNGEHFFEWELTSPATKLAWHDYHTWTFALWMDKTFGEGSVRATYEAFGTQRSAPAISKAIGGLRKHYLDYARHAWNQAPLKPSFVAWDGAAMKPANTPQHLFLAGQHKRTAYVPMFMDELSRLYRPFEITDDKVKEVVVRNTLAADPDARVGAILTLRSGGTRFEDWSGRKTVTFCRDTPSQDITAMVLVFADSAIGEHRVQGTPEIGLRDTCDDLPWHYKVLSATTEQWTDGTRDASGLQSCGLRGYSIHSRVDFKAQTTAPAAFDPEDVVEAGYGTELNGQVYAEAPAKWTHQLDGCQHLWDPPTTACSTTLERTPTPNGTWPVGFSVEAASKDAPTATLHWSVQDPSVGFIDADDSVCNVSQIWKGLDYDALQQEVPMSKLSGTAPVTLSFQGGGDWAADQSGFAAIIKAGWKVTMTVQRVDAEGKPL